MPVASADEPAFRLLARACANAAPRAVPRPTADLAAAVEDWDAFLALITLHRVAGLADRVLAGEQAVPPPVRATLAAQAKAIARQNLTMAAETVRLQRLFDAADLPASFFKGVALSERAYGSPLLKHGKDIDFLVAPDEVERCVALLTDAGYHLRHPRPTLSARQWPQVLRYRIQVELAHTTSGAQVEPHWALSENTALLPAAPLATAAGAGWDRIGQVPLRTFHPDDQFAYLCVHGARSGWFRLKWLADLHALIADASAEELTRLAAHAATRGAGAAADIALALCADTFDLSVPQPILARATARPARRLLLNACRTYLRASEQSPARAAQVAVLLAAAEGKLAGDLWRWTISPDDAIDHPLPRPLHFAYRLLRAPLWLRRQLRYKRPVNLRSG